MRKARTWLNFHPHNDLAFGIMIKRKGVEPNVVKPVHLSSRRGSRTSYVEDEGTRFSIRTHSSSVTKGLSPRRSRHNSPRFSFSSLFSYQLLEIMRMKLMTMLMIMIIIIMMKVIVIIMIIKMMMLMIIIKEGLRYGKLW